MKHHYFSRYLSFLHLILLLFKSLVSFFESISSRNFSSSNSSIIIVVAITIIIIADIFTIATIPADHTTFDSTATVTTNSKIP